MTEWKWKLVGVKDMIREESSIENTIALCSWIKPQFRRISPSRKDFDADSLYWIEENLEVIKDNFDFLKRLLDGSIPASKWDDYDFSLDRRETWFNGYLDELYDFGDTAIKQNNGKIVKMLWIG